MKFIQGQNGRSKWANARFLVYRGSHEAIEALVDGLPAILPDGWSHFCPEGPEFKSRVPDRYVCYTRKGDGEEEYIVSMLVKPEQASIEAIKPIIGDALEEPQYAELLMQFEAIARPLAQSLGLTIIPDAPNSSV